MSIPTDCLLLQAHGLEAAPATAALQAACALWAEALGPLQLERAARTADGTLYAYLALARPRALEASAVAAAEQQLAARGLLPTPRLSPLQAVMDRDGASAGAPVGAHYIVEMDPEDGWMPEIGRWYDQEHMPGLAAVPGTVRARRFLNHGHGPLSLACYDLVAPEVLGCPAWLAVRATAWSDIARPHFTNTRRSMCTLLV